MKIKMTIFLFLFIASFDLTGQRGQSKSVWELPPDYDLVLIDDERGKFELQVNILTPSSKHEVPASKRNERRNPWIVFSDRDNNPLYTDQTLKETNGSVASIGTKFFVTNEVFDALEVIELEYDPDSDLTYSETENTVKSRGWISKKNLILWSKPLISSKTRFELKAFLVNSDQENISKITSGEMKKDLVELFNSPDSKTVSEEQQLYEVLFVYKYDEDNKRFLVGSEPTLKGLEYQLFWVSRFRLKTWNTRVALEWNYDPVACEERKKNNLKTGIFFKNPASAELLRDGKFTLEQFRRAEYTSAIDPCSSNRIEGALDPSNPRRYNGNVMRYPFFGNSSDMRDIIQCGAIVKLGFQAELNNYTELADWPEIKNNLEEIIEAGKFVNCMLVFHGSPDMAQQREMLQYIIDQFSKLNKTDIYNGRVKIGAVIFKGKNDQQKTIEFAPGGEPTDIEDLKNKINDSRLYTAQGNTDCRGVVKYGLKKAILNGFQKNETNIAIVVGSCGDAHLMVPTEYDESYVNDKDLQNLLYEYNVNVLAIQSHVDERRVRESSRFFSDIDGILSNVTNKISDDYSAFAEEKSMSDDTHFTTHLWDFKREVSTQFDYKFLSESHLSMGIVYAPNIIGSRLAPIALSSIIEDFVSDVGKKNKSIIEALENAIYDDSPVGERAGESGSELTKSLIGKGLSANDIKIAQQKKVQLLQEGYTAMTAEGLEHNIYKYVLFMKGDALADLTQKMREITSRGGTSMEQREALVDAWYEYAGAVLNQDPKILKEEFHGEKSRDLQSILLGGIRELDQSSEHSIFSKYPADVILEEGGRVSKEELRKYLEKIRDNRDQLVNLRQNEEMVYRTKRHEFYWVDVDLLP